ncbi:MAG: hypothetical protein NVSMB56_03000 [Pyrinomonadaceae bacterium]
MSIAPSNEVERALHDCASDVETLHAHCVQRAPAYEISLEEFFAAVGATAQKYLASYVAKHQDAKSTAPKVAPVALRDEVRRFLSELQIEDLYMALACARGNETAWWDFDRKHRGFIESVARHLAGSAAQAEEVVEFVYAELYGTRIVDGVRLSKFATYAGRGSMRGWLRAVVWHATVDAHRARHDEVSIEEWSEAGGEAQERPGKRDDVISRAERAIIGEIARGRYEQLASEALEKSFAALTEHEKLLLLLYHVENLKLREIARLVEDASSPLRRWFQRHPRRCEDKEAKTPRVHESTVMRWLEKVYARLQESFCRELASSHNLRDEEIQLCLELAAGDDNVLRGDIRKYLT